MLELKQLYKKYNRREAYAVNGVDLCVGRGELLALVGESGSGKTTLLRLVAGFEIPQQGQIFLNGECVYGERAYIKPEKRRIGMVFQDYALFPHLTVYQNILFGLGRRKQAEKQERALQVLQLVGLESYQHRYPHELSGGQQQRTALARALAPEPDLILLDEPFSNLDGVLKEQVRRDMREIIKQTGTTAVFVTHDTKDALATADRIAILREGSIEQCGSPRTLYEKPVNTYVATFFGQINLLKGMGTNEGYRTALGTIPFGQQQSLPPSEEVILCIRPEHISCCPPAESHFEGLVQEVSYLGEYQQVHLLIQKEVSIILKVAPDLTIRPQDSLAFCIQTEKIRLLPASFN